MACSSICFPARVHMKGWCKTCEGCSCLSFSLFCAAPSKHIQFFFFFKSTFKSKRDKLMKTSDTVMRYICSWVTGRFFFDAYSECTWTVAFDVSSRVSLALTFRSETAGAMTRLKKPQQTMKNAHGHISAAAFCLDGRQLHCDEWFNNSQWNEFTRT